VSAGRPGQGTCLTGVVCVGGGEGEEEGAGAVPPRTRGGAGCLDGA
jgi:hypothetical protein